MIEHRKIPRTRRSLQIHPVRHAGIRRYDVDHGREPASKLTTSLRSKFMTNGAAKSLTRSAVPEGGPVPGCRALPGRVARAGTCPNCKVTGGPIRQSCSSEQKFGRENLVASEPADTVRVSQGLFTGTRIDDVISASPLWGNMSGNSRCTRHGFFNGDTNLALPFNLHQPPHQAPRQPTNRVPIKSRPAGSSHV